MWWLYGTAMFPVALVDAIRSDDARVHRADNGRDGQSFLAIWDALTARDPEVRNAADRAASLGPGYEMILAQTYLSRGSRDHLESVLADVIAEAEENRRSGYCLGGHRYALTETGRYRVISGRWVNSDFPTLADLRSTLSDAS